MSLPPDWVEKTDEKSGKPYFVNSKTKERTWKRPSVAATAATAELVATTPVEAGAPPSDWVERKDEKTGKTFYYNKTTKETSWKIPASLPSQQTPPTNAVAVIVNVAAAAPLEATGEIIPLSTVLPPDWTERKDEKTGKTFYYNTKTKATSWKIPASPPQQQAPPSESVAAAIAPVEAAGEATPLSPALPPDWVERNDEKSGKAFFYNKKTKETSWKFPTNASTPPAVLAVPTTTNVSTPQTSASDWTEKKDERSGKTYYFNTKTKERTWTRPAELAAAAADSGSAARPATALPSALGALPPDWMERKDAKTGKTYFYNAKTKATSWTRPVDAAAASPLSNQVQPNPAALQSIAHSALPPDWVVKLGRTGGSYYYNTKTKVTSWMCPPPLDSTMASLPLALLPFTSPSGETNHEEALSSSPDWCRKIDVTEFFSSVFYTNAKNGEILWVDRRTGATCPQVRLDDMTETVYLFCSRDGSGTTEVLRFDGSRWVPPPPSETSLPTAPATTTTSIGASRGGPLLLPFDVRVFAALPLSTNRVSCALLGLTRIGDTVAAKTAESCTQLRMLSRRWFAPLPGSLGVVGAVPDASGRSLGVVGAASALDTGEAEEEAEELAARLEALQAQVCFGAGCAAVVRGLVATGGYSDVSMTKTRTECVLCDLAPRRFSGGHPSVHRLPPLNVGRAGHTLAVVDVSSATRVLWVLYAVGGFDGDAKSPAVERYVLGDKCWERMSDLPVPRSGHGCAVINRSVYVFGGRTAFSVTNTGCFMHPQSDRWMETRPMRHARCSFGVASVGQYVFVAGGFDGRTFLPFVEAYDSSLDVWRDVSALDVPYRSISACALRCALSANSAASAVREDALMTSTGVVAASARSARDGQ